MSKRNIFPGSTLPFVWILDGGIFNTPVSEAITNKLSVVIRYRAGLNPFRSKIAHTLSPSDAITNAGPSQGSIIDAWYS